MRVAVLVIQASAGVEPATKTGQWWLFAFACRKNRQ